MSSHQVSLIDLLRQRGEATSAAESRRSAQRTAIVLLGVCAATTLIVDVLVAACLYASRNDWNWTSIRDEIRGWSRWQDALTFDSNVVDCVALALARAIVVPLLCVVAVKLGQPKYGRGASAPAENAAANAVPLLDPTSGEEGELSVGGAATLNATDSVRIGARSAASCRKVAVLTLLFVASVCSQVYIGVKVS